jgi:hypothetical protein
MDHLVYNSSKGNNVTTINGVVLDDPQDVRNEVIFKKPQQQYFAAINNNNNNNGSKKMIMNGPQFGGGGHIKAARSVTSMNR